jgi:hypothetical protein
MRVTLCCLLIFFSTLVHAFEKTDSARAKLNVSAIFSLNSNGIASIPAFSLDEPALMATLALKKNRFSYEPVLAYGLDLKPWIIDNWFNYKIIVRPSFEFITGINISAYFSEYALSGDSILQSQRYFTFAFTGVYKISPASALSLAYWNDRGQDKGTLMGHFISLMGERSGIKIMKNLLLSVNIQLYYINYSGNNDGLFLSPKISSTIKSLPFTVLFQCNQALVSNISPFPGFTWNVGIGYTL